MRTRARLTRDDLTVLILIGLGLPNGDIAAATHSDVEDVQRWGDRIAKFTTARAGRSVDGAGLWDREVQVRGVLEAGGKMRRLPNT
jgi:hypothetical protein